MNQDSSKKSPGEVRGKAGNGLGQGPVLQGDGTGSPPGWLWTRISPLAMMTQGEQDYGSRRRSYSRDSALKDPFKTDEPVLVIDQE